MQFYKRGGVYSGESGDRRLFVYIEDSSLDKIMHCIATSFPISAQSDFMENGLRQGELAMEGFHGIIRQGNKFHAVLQSE